MVEEMTTSPSAPVGQVNLHEAKTNPSRLVAEAVAGEGLVICKVSKPLAQVTRLAGADDPVAPPRRRLGQLVGQVLPARRLRSNRRWGDC